VAKGQTIRLIGQMQRDMAKRLIDLAPDGAVVNVQEAKRTTDQNAKMWAMLSDISRAKPDGRKMAPELWKAAIMASFGYELRFELDLDGRPFPAPFSTSALSVAEMRDLIEFMYSRFPDVRWSEPNPYEERKAA